MGIKIQKHQKKVNRLVKSSIAFNFFFGINSVLYINSQNNFEELLSKKEAIRAINISSNIDKISHLTKCEDLNELPSIFRKFFKYKNYNKINKNLDKEINYFYEISKKPYNKKLFSIVKKLI